MKLSIDTSFKEVSVALLSGDTIHTKNELAPMKQSEVLSRLIKELLSVSEQSLESISEIIISAGPGSFTGLRVSYAWAKGFAIAQPCHITQVSFFENVLSEGIFVMPSGKDRFLVYETSLDHEPNMVDKKSLELLRGKTIFTPNEELLPIESSSLDPIATLLLKGKIIATARTTEEISKLVPCYGLKTPFLTLKERGVPLSA